MERKLNAIVATALNSGIGFQGTIPWRFKKDMAHFARLTKWTEDPNKKNAVIMGRRTWESIPQKNRPLPNRLNIILSQTIQSVENEVLVCQSLEASLKLLGSSPYSEQIENVWIIGGSTVYKEAMENPNFHRIYVTRVLENYTCDVFMPPIDMNKFSAVSDPRVPEDVEEEEGVQLKFEVYEKYA